MIEIIEKRKRNKESNYTNFVLDIKEKDYYIFHRPHLLYMFIVDTFIGKEKLLGRRISIVNGILKEEKYQFSYSVIAHASEGERCYLLEDSEAVLFEIVGPIQFLRMNNLLPG